MCVSAYTGAVRRKLLCGDWIRLTSSWCMSAHWSHSHQLHPNLLYQIVTSARQGSAKTSEGESAGVFECPVCHRRRACWLSEL